MAGGVVLSAAEPPGGKALTRPRSQHQTQQQTRDRQGHDCRHCHAPLEEGARFCGECGASTGEPCPHCGAEVGGGDFCEACGHWLREGQCRFCYAELIDGATFCTECGNDQNGLWCSRCQANRFFDFCGGCGDALSDAAQQMAQQAPADPALAAALQALHELGRQAPPVAPATLAPPPPSAGRPAGLNLAASLRSVRDTEQRQAATAEAARQQAEAARREAEAARQAEQARLAAEQRRAAREAQDAAEREQEMAQSQASQLTLSAQLRAARERVQALLAAAEGLTFADPQTARRHFMAMRVKLAREGQAPRAWRCNFADCEHDTPNECADPSQGGRWLFD